ncbi:MAG: hypothetical protein ACE5JF_11105 [Anaerolineales bacterium]
MIRWLFLILGFGIGLAGGLYYAWQVSPVEYVETAPDSLRADFRADYLGLIASAYASGGDLVRARTRLALFPDLDPATELAALAQQRLAAGLVDTEANALSQLASALSLGPTRTPSPSGRSPSVSPTPSNTPRPSPTRRPTATQGAAFHLASRDQICDPQLSKPLIQVVVLDAAENPVPGKEIIVLWNTGQDHFFTGLKPELGLGYGDFAMTEGISYTLQLADTQQPITNLSTHECEGEDDKPYLGSWLLQFEQSP